MTLLTKYRDPFLSWDPFFQQFTDILDTFVHNPKMIMNSQSGFPKANVYMTKDKKYTIEASIAGYNIDDVGVYLDEAGNSITFEYKNCPKESEDNDRVYIVRELKQSNFESKFILPKFVNLKDPKQSFKNGIIKIEFDIISEDKPERKKLTF